jgi:hypothetical protein
VARVGLAPIIGLSLFVDMGHCLESGKFGAVKDGLQKKQVGLRLKVIRFDENRWSRIVETNGP